MRRFILNYIALAFLMCLTLAIAVPANSQSSQVSNNKARLIKAINELRSGTANMNQFEPMLRIAIQQQKDKSDAYFAAMGPIKDVTYVGPQNGGDVFQVTFEHGVSAWWIQMAANGNIAGLMYQ